MLIPTVYAKNYDSIKRGCEHAENHTLGAVGRGTIKPVGAEESGSVKIYIGACIDPTPNSDGDFMGHSNIVMRFSLPDGTKISMFRDIPFFVDFEGGVLQGFLIKFPENDVYISAYVVNKKVYGHMSASIIAHEATHIVDCYLKCQVTPPIKDWATGSY
jgi:hypothetical protein